ncbi:MAG: hypothetical protein ACP5XB_25395 [Isosphaeraceae bacterium]
MKETAGRIGKVRDAKAASLDDTIQAHLEEYLHRIAKVLEANFDVRQP